MTSESLQDHNESTQLILKNALTLSELSCQLKNKTNKCEDHLNSLNNLIFLAGKDISSLYDCVDSLLLLAKQLVYMTLQAVPPNDLNFNRLKSEAEKLLTVLNEMSENEVNLDESVKHTYLKTNLSTKSLYVDEKYPEHCSRECLLDKSSIVPLPTVPEDAFTDFCRPNRTKSSNSLKNLRRVKLCLQKMYDDNMNGACDSIKISSESTTEDQNKTLNYITEEPNREKTI